MPPGLTRRLSLAIRVAGLGPSITRSLQKVALAAAYVAGFSACEDSSAAATSDVTSTSADVVIDEEALIEGDLCEHSTEGPYKSLSAGADRATAPEAYFPHTLITVAGSGTAGVQYVKLSISEAGEHIIGAGRATGVVVTDSAGVVVEVEEEQTVTACEGMTTAYHLDLGIGTYYIGFEPSGADAGFVILTGAHEEHDEEKPE